MQVPRPQLQNCLAANDPEAWPQIRPRSHRDHDRRPAERPQAEDAQARPLVADGPRGRPARQPLRRRRVRREAVRDDRREERREGGRQAGRQRDAVPAPEAPLPRQQSTGAGAQPVASWRRPTDAHGRPPRRRAETGSTLRALPTLPPAAEPPRNHWNPGEVDDTETSTTRTGARATRTVRPRTARSTTPTTSTTTTT